MDLVIHLFTIQKCTVRVGEVLTSILEFIKEECSSALMIRLNLPQDPGPMMRFYGISQILWSVYEDSILFPD